MSAGPLRTTGRELDREGAFIARLRLGASPRVTGRELIARGLAFGSLIARARGADERLLIDLGGADRLLIERDGADRLLGAARLARGALARGAEREAARLLPFERDWAAASGAVKASDKAAIIATNVEVQARLNRAADIVNLPSSGDGLALRSYAEQPIMVQLL